MLWARDIDGVLLDYQDRCCRAERLRLGHPATPLLGKLARGSGHRLFGHRSPLA